MILSTSNVWCPYINAIMSVFLRNVILDIYTYLCNVFAYFENFMRYIIYKMHILYNNMCKRARDARSARLTQWYCPYGQWYCLFEAVILHFVQWHCALGAVADDLNVWISLKKSIPCLGSCAGADKHFSYCPTIVFQSPVSLLFQIIGFEKQV